MEAALPSVSMDSQHSKERLRLTVCSQSTTLHWYYSVNCTSPTGPDSSMGDILPPRGRSHTFSEGGVAQHGLLPQIVPDPQGGQVKTTNFRFKKAQQVIEEDDVHYVDATPSVQSDQTVGLFHTGGSERFFHIPTVERYRKYLRFTFQDKAFEFCVLPSGLSPSPWMFTV